MKCGYELKDEQGNTLIECSDVVEWIRNNTPKQAG